MSTAALNNSDQNVVLFMGNTQSMLEEITQQATYLAVIADEAEQSSGGTISTDEAESLTQSGTEPVLTVGSVNGSEPETEPVLVKGSSGSRFVVTSGNTRTFYHTTFAELWAEADGGAGEVQAGGTLNAYHVKFMRNYAINSGGAVYNAGTATFASCTFTENITYCEGGAVFYNSGTVSITGCTFTRNTAGLNPGGAVFNNSGTVSIESSIFSGNTAGWYGGGALCSEVGTVSITGCTFTENITDWEGGAVYNKLGTASIISCTFIGNTAQYYGGAVYTEGFGLIETITTIESSTFSRNTACCVNGGAVYSVVLPAPITGCTFTENTACDDGGAVSAAVSIMTDCTFTGNTAGNNGGAMEGWVEGGMTNCTFAENTAGNNGGAMEGWVEGGMTNCTFTGNTAGNNGGAMEGYVNGGMTGCTFAENTAGNNGGAVYNTGTVTVNSSTFSGNAAKTYGGAIYNTKTVNLTGDVVLSTSSDSIAWDITSGTSSYATMSGYSYLRNNGNAELTIVVTDEQECGQYTIASDAEAVLAGSKKTFTLRGVDSSSESITVDAGNVVYGSRWYSLDRVDSTKLVLSVGTPHDLTGDSNISPMYAGGVTFTVYDKTVTRTKNGDTVTLTAAVVDQFELAGYTNNAGVTITDDKFTMPDQDITVKAQYRFDVAAGNTLTLVSGTYTNELGYDDNGGMGEVQEGGTLIANNVTFSGNTAANKGGAIYNDGTITLSNVTFTGNAGNGGAIYNEGTVTLTGVVTLSSETDTFVNDDGVNWDLTGGTASYGKLNGYQYFTNNAHLTITVNNDQAEGEYILATGVTGVEGKNQFTLTGAGTEKTITVGSSELLYGGKYYALTQEKSNLVLSIGPVKYMDYSTDNKNYVEKKCTEYTVLTGSEKALTDADGWYVIDSTTTAFGSAVSVSGDVHVIVKDGAALTVDSFAVNSGATLNLYGQSGFTGTVTATNGFSGSGNVKAQIDVTATDDLTTGTTEFTPGKYLYGADGTLTYGGTLITDRVFAGKKITTAGEYNVATSMTVVSSSVNAHRIVSGACVSVAGDVTLRGGSSLTISNNNVFSDEYVICGSQAITGSRVTQDGSNTIEISGGTYTGMVCGAGFVGHKDSSYNLTGNVTMTISGGTFTYALLGGVGVTRSSYAKDSIVSGNINMTFDCSSNQITLNCVYGGCGGKATLNGNITMKFTGNGNNLNFVGKKSGVAGGNVENRGMWGTTNGDATLLFDDFNGLFNAQAIDNFKTLDFDNGSAVTFKDFGGTETKEHVAQLDTKMVEVWDFATGTSLNYQHGNNSFSGDELIFGSDGGSISSPWTVIDGGDDNIFAGLDTAESVTLFGESAEYDKEKSYWASTNYKLTIDTNNHDLVVSKLA